MDKVCERTGWIKKAVRDLIVKKEMVVEEGSE